MLFKKESIGITVAVRCRGEVPKFLIRERACIKFLLIYSPIDLIRCCILKEADPLFLIRTRTGASILCELSEGSLTAQLSSLLGFDTLRQI